MMLLPNVLFDKCKDRQSQEGGEENSRRELRRGKKGEKVQSPLGISAHALLFIEAGLQQKNDRYLCTLSTTAQTNKHTQMYAY